jgi:PST family polysaccharide transporter
LHADFSPGALEYQADDGKCFPFVCDIYAPPRVEFLRTTARAGIDVDHVQERDKVHRAESTPVVDPDIERVRVIKATLFLLMFVLAPDLLPTVFGPRWDDAIPVLQLLSLAGVAYSLATQDWLLLLVRNKTITLLGLTSIVTVAISVAAAIGLAWGIVGVAAAYAIAQWAVVVPSALVVSRSASVPLRALGGSMTSPLPFVAGATAAAYAVRIALVEVGVPAWARMAIVSVVLVGLYVGLAYAGSKALREEIRSAVTYTRSRLPGRTAPAAPV